MKLFRMLLRVAAANRLPARFVRASSPKRHYNDIGTIVGFSARMPRYQGGNMALSEFFTELHALLSLRNHALFINQQLAMNGIWLLLSEFFTELHTPLSYEAIPSLLIINLRYMA